jgi:hypothetical protein
MTVGSHAEPLPAGTKAQLARFTELAAIAIANAETQADLVLWSARNRSAVRWRPNCSRPSGCRPSDS